MPHHGQVGAVEIRVPGGRAQYLGTQAQVALDQGRRLNGQGAVQRIHRQRQARPHVVLDRGQMRLPYLVPDAGSSVPAAHQAVCPVVLHGDACATYHDVKLVMHHELGQCPPQSQYHAAVAVFAVHAAAAQLHHTLAQAAQAREIKLGVAVGAADPLSLRRRQDAVGADYLLAGFVAHQQVFAAVVEQVDVVAWQRSLQPRAHFTCKYVEPQTLRLPDFVLVPGPGHPDAATSFCRPSHTEILPVSMKRPPGKRHQRQREHGVGDFFHAVPSLFMAPSLRLRDDSNEALRWQLGDTPCTGVA